jgi:uncharacterized protein (DUF1501 family)
MLTLAGTGISLGLSRKAYASSGKNALVILFFRGGMDALNLLVPRNGVNRSHYETFRPNIQIPTNRILNLDGAFGLPEQCGALRSLYNDRDLALIHSVGMPDGQSSRSHFESMAMYELGTPGQTTANTGWLARHLQSNPVVTGDEVIASMAPGNAPESLVGDSRLMAIDSADTNGFHPNGGRYAEEHMAALRGMYNGNSPLDQAMQGTLDNVEILTDLTLSIPGFYPDDTLARDLALVAQVIKADLGMHVATVDFGGWDTHQNMGDGGTGYFVDRLGQVSDAIGAFFRDLNSAGMKDRVMLVTQTDFGRRVRENGNRGTDHGSGQVMLVAGGNVNGGQILGQFPGIHPDQLYKNSDLRPTTDFRQPLSEIIRGHLGNPNVDTVFPGWDGSVDMGLVSNKFELPGDLLLDTSFES